MPFKNIGLLVKENLKRTTASALPPVRYYLRSQGKICVIRINKDILEKCKFEGKYCRVLFDEESQLIRIQECKDRYEKGAYKWHVSTDKSTAAIEFTFLPESLISLPKNYYVVSKFHAMAQSLDIVLLPTDITPLKMRMKRKKNDTDTSSK